MLHKENPWPACHQFLAVVITNTCRAFLKELPHSHFIDGKTQKQERTYPSQPAGSAQYSYYRCILASPSNSCYSYPSNKIQTIIIIFIAICTAARAGGHKQESAMLGSVQTYNQVYSPCSSCLVGTQFCGNTKHGRMGGRDREGECECKVSHCSW